MKGGRVTKGDGEGGRKGEVVKAWKVNGGRAWRHKAPYRGKYPNHT